MTVPSPLVSYTRVLDQQDIRVYPDQNLVITPDGKKGLYW